MREITIRIYDGDNPSVINAVDKQSKINFDDEVYSNLNHLVLDHTVHSIGIR